MRKRSSFRKVLARLRQGRPVDYSVLMEIDTDRLRARTAGQVLRWGLYRQDVCIDA